MSTQKKPVVVCVDDDDAMLATVSRCLRREASLDVRTTMSASEALAWIAEDEIAVLVSDYEMPEMTGAQLAGHARRVRPETVRILLTGLRTLETAVDGINQGEIFRFLGKPFENETLRAAVLAGVERNRELLLMSGERQRRERRETLVRELESEYPGISRVKKIDETYAVDADPWLEASALGLAALTLDLEQSS
jgi:DNA-binding NtrC family response regulator